MKVKTRLLDQNVQIKHGITNLLVEMEIVLKCQIYYTFNVVRIGGVSVCF